MQRRTGFVAWGWMWLLACGIVVSTADADEPTGIKLDPQADALLRQASNYYKNLQSFRVDQLVTYKVKTNTEQEEWQSKYELKVKRPGRFAMNLLDGEYGQNIVTDGKETMVYTPYEFSYRLWDFTGKLEDLLPLVNAEMVGGAEPYHLQLFLDSDPYDEVTRGAKQVAYAGEEAVDDVPCQRIQFEEGGVKWEMWIAKGDTPQIQKMRAELTPLLLARISSPPPGLAFEAEHRFSHWETNGEIADAHFEIDPPKLDLLGETAPDFTLRQLDDKAFRLSEQKGKYIVILDFWATWCPPCQKSMPILEKVAAEFKDQGVILVGVNQGEEKPLIKHFLELKNLKLLAVMDELGMVAEQYKVEGLPKTVIVDKDGIIQSAHMGVVDGMEEALREELKALVAGKHLVKRL